MLTYWRQSRSLFYSLLAVFPLLLVYEIGLFAIQTPNLPQIRNGADVLLQEFLSSFGIKGLMGFGLLFIIGTIVAFYWNRNRDPEATFSSVILLGIVAESCGWGLVLVLLLQSFQAFLMSPIVREAVHQVILGLGAGLYEELVFRVLLISGLVPLLKMVFQWTETGAKIIAVLLAAAIFSGFHFWGALGESATASLFILRFLAGAMLGFLYIFRGFGITAWSHAIYDLITVIQLTIMNGNHA